jgi:exodeoxyribonuclease-3
MIGDKARRESDVPLSIATWNVNSINARLETALSVLKTLDADVVCLQELKCEDAKFPRGPIEDLGYNVETHGQKTYNGVAILSRHRLEDVSRGLPGGDGADDHARYLEALVSAPGGVFRVASLYAPNGNPTGTDKFAYKLAWMDRLIAHARVLLALEEPFALAGDYNVIPRDADADDPASWAGDALITPEARAKYRTLLNLGVTDAFMAADGRAGQYTFWDYQAGAWRRNHGIRIDHLALSPKAAERLAGVQIHRDARALEKPSDHVPVLARFAD